MKKRECKRFNIPGTTLEYRKPPFLFFNTRYADRCYPVVNLSKGGLKFLCDQKLAPGRSIILKLDIPGAVTIPEIHARIRWIARNREASYKYQTGLSFNPYGTGKYENPREILSLIESLETGPGGTEESGPPSSPQGIKQSQESNNGTDFA